MRIRAGICQPSIGLVALSFSAIGASAESNQIRQAVSDKAMFEISLYNEANVASVLDGNIETVLEPISDYVYPKAKRSYKMRVRISGRSKGQPTDYGDYLF